MSLKPTTNASSGSTDAMEAGSHKGEMCRDVPTLLLRFFSKSSFPLGFQMVASGRSSSVWACKDSPVGCSYLFKYQRSDKLKGIDEFEKNRIIHKIHHEARILNKLAYIATLYAPTPVFLLQNRTVDIPIMQMHCAGNMTIGDAFRMTLDAFTNAERALVLLQIFDCVQLCTRGKLKINDLANPQNTMITWRGLHDEPRVQVIDCQDWKFQDDEGDDEHLAQILLNYRNERQILVLLSLLQRYKFREGPECVTSQVLSSRNSRGEFEKERVLALLCLHSIVKYPTATQLLEQRFRISFHQPIPLPHF